MVSKCKHPARGYVIVKNAIPHEITDTFFSWRDEHNALEEQNANIDTCTLHSMHICTGLCTLLPLLLTKT
jgi:hypothetical protein